MATVPPAWRHTNPWGPAANEARAEGTLVPLFRPERQAEWEAFAREHIRDGDILFRYGVSYYRLPDRLATRVIAGISDSRFSHNALAVWEGDALYVYDAQPEPEGIRKIPFTFWMLDTTPGTLEIKRPRPEYQFAVPQALAYCEDAYQRQVPFDPALKPDDERLYCSEMIEKAYRSAGVALADPITIRCLPNYHRYRALQPVVQTFTEIRVDTPAFALGNEHYGTYGSPCLELVYQDCPDRPRTPPTCPPVPWGPAPGCASAEPAPAGLPE
jgi:hypothetical protein